MSQSVKSTNELRKVLIDTIENVREGSITPAAANAVGNLAGKVLQSAKLDLDVMRLASAGFERSPAPLLENSKPTQVETAEAS